MCDVCYQAGIPALPRELDELKQRRVIADWQLSPDKGWRIKQRVLTESVVPTADVWTSRWTDWLSERDMQAFLDTELQP